ncbi:hypothetical protein FPH17_03160 [Corynebacterium godavarianum]|uniref:histidine kinase n=1 Tax=Corynebacterium godavarianum TaxID=2054421 RepID=A0ABY3E6H2_9CORY|nr:histidine kinase [Corynebacterium godavarianum]MBL7285740.1 hypothetical protein [Corynebacterium godavarianum]TSJ75426.1 hypothetical protein FPH17_03160 [Corynebacterium godavarianum]
MPRTTPPPPIRVRDVVIAIVLAACAELGAVSASQPVWATAMLVVWTVAAPFTRWRWPITTALSACALLGIRACGTELTIAEIVVAVFTAYIARRNLRPVLRDVAAAALVVGDLLALSLVSPVLRGMPLDELLPYLAWSATLLVAAGLFGELRRRAEETAARELEQALQQQRIELEHAMSEQRAFLAREIHDVVTHSLAVMVAQADGGRYCGDGDSALAAKDEALRTIGEVGRESLTQMREVVTLLRAPETRPVAPSPHSLNLDELVRTSRLGGLDVDYAEAGTPPEQLPLATAIATRRMVQEALTNALKHGDSRASLDVTWQDELVVIEVVNTIAAPPSGPSDGHGLRGMRERASLIDATVYTGPAHSNTGAQQWVTELRVPYTAPHPKEQA